VLAAGGSSRLGRPKQLIRLRGEPLLLRACRMASAVADTGIVVVLGAGALRLRTLLQRHARDVVIAHNAAWADGMAGSLRKGLECVLPAADGLLILLVDQPGTTAADLVRLAREWRRSPGRPAAAYYRGSAGAPAIFPRRLFPALRSLQGDHGARQILRKSAAMIAVAIPAAAIDVDTEQDVARLSGSPYTGRARQDASA
jgi:CTP:molybdopterin cytidylyltransferase MocA